MSGFNIPDSVRQSQRRAADPRASAWVSANAGSGKTTVLARRVVRLLLAGVKPSRILCLTFTKAAAANMQNRVFGDLSRWTTLDAGRLATELTDLDGAAPNVERLALARRLFAEAIETPGGLKILTIHGFCERVLRQFPFEANVPAGFTVLEPRVTQRLLDEARASVVIRAVADRDGTLGRALEEVVQHTGEDGFAALMGEATKEREAIAALLAESGGAGNAAARLRAALGLDPDMTTAGIEQAIVGGGLAESEWRSIAGTLHADGLATDRKRAEALDLAAAARGKARLDAYLDVFLDSKGKIRKPDSLISKGIRQKHPSLADRLEAERQRVDGLIAARLATQTLERSTALLALAEAMIGLYEAGKKQAAALDFDDLVARARDLLERAGAEWVLYKLDQGIDHILVDEAQDTSPDQWRIVERLAAEFTAGEGARTGPTRTIFAVGDEKQSIFSFQGAEPDAFARMKRHFHKRVTEAGERFEAVELGYSFRSAGDILAAVDAVFADAGNRCGLSFDDVPTLHQTVRDKAAGRVEVWPVEKPVDLPEIEAWDAPFDTQSAESPPVRLARRIAGAVARWTRDGDPETGDLFDPGDVLVLVRKRNALFHAVIRELKRARLPVAGADRLVLTEHVAVMDLMALGRFALLPDDDLTLATVLKSPLIGFDDEDLMRLAPQRAGRLLDALAGEAEASARSRLAFDRLKAWIADAARLPPFAFYAGVLSRDGGRRALLAQLGQEAADALDEFLNAALAYESSATPSLEGFLAWLNEARTEVKRDMDVARGEVRVMTVHGAKGLEAPVVFLADTCTAPDGRHDPALFFVRDQSAHADAAPLVMWVRGQDHDPPLAAARRAEIRASAEAEHRRLLYVAMTRAGDRLIVAGHEGATARPGGNWYDMIAGALRDKGAVSTPMQDGEGDRLVFETGTREAAPRIAQAVAVAETPVAPWLRQAAPTETVADVLLRPSGAEENDSVQPVPASPAGDAGALLRGRLVHRLLQSLPDLAGDKAEAARRFLARAVPREADQHDGLVREVIALMEDARFAALFGPQSRAEVPIAGRVARNGRPDLLVSGRIDRLSIVGEDVLIADFKTNARVPIEIPETYVAQLALYRHVVGRVFPERRVRALIAWTAGPHLSEVPAALLDAAFATQVA